VEEYKIERSRTIHLKAGDAALVLRDRRPTVVFEPIMHPNDFSEGSLSAAIISLMAINRLAKRADIIDPLIKQILKEIGQLNEQD